MMPAIETAIATDRPQRYLKQLGDHAAAMSGDRTRHRAMHADHDSPVGEPTLHVEATDERVVLTFTPSGRCIVTSSAGELHIRIEAPDYAGLRRIQQIVTSDLQRFGHREQLVLGWRGETSD